MGLVDVCQAIPTLLLAHQPSQGMQELASRLRIYLDGGQLRCGDDTCWTSWRLFRAMPAYLWEEFMRSDLVTIKGNVNYRLLVDDRHWPASTSLEAAAGYYRTSLVILRTIKSELVVRLEPGQEETMQAQDPDWSTSGKFRLIQVMRIEDDNSGLFRIL